VEEELVTLAMEQVEAQRCRRENRGISPRNMGISWEFMGFHGIAWRFHGINEI
jgi:hypothetical protein